MRVTVLLVSTSWIALPLCAQQQVVVDPPEVRGSICAHGYVRLHGWTQRIGIQGQHRGPAGNSRAAGRHHQTALSKQPANQARGDVRSRSPHQYDQLALSWPARFTR